MLRKDYQHLNIHEWWEEFKIKMKQKFLEVSKNSSKQRDINLTNCYACWNELEQKKEQMTLTRTAIDRIKNKITQLETEIVEGSIFRSKAQWIREGERNTKYFFALEKRNSLTKLCIRLLNQMGRR